MTTVTTKQELIDALTELDVERWTKRAIYQDIKYGYTFGAANHDDLLTRKRKYPLYTYTMYTMPDTFTVSIDGELLETMTTNARQRVRAVEKRERAYAPVRIAQDRKVTANQQSHTRVGDECAGLLAAYGWVDHLAGGPGADRGDQGGGALPEAAQRRSRPPCRQPPAREQAPDGPGRATSAATNGLV